MVLTGDGRRVDVEERLLRLRAVVTGPRSEKTHSEWTFAGWFLLLLHMDDDI